MACTKKTHAQDVEVVRYALTAVQNSTTAKRKMTYLVVKKKWRVFVK